MREGGKDCSYHACAKPGHSGVRSGRLEIITFIDMRVISDDRWEGWSVVCPSARTEKLELVLEALHGLCALMMMVWSHY